VRPRSTAAYASRFTRMRHNRSTAADQARGHAHNGHVTRSRIELSLQRLGNLRDAFIVVGGSIYACGFVAWGVVSIFNFGFGLSGANYAQYFVAGIVPFLGISLACFTLAKGLGLIRDFESKIKNTYRFPVGFSLLVFCFAIMLASGILHSKLEGGRTSFILSLIIFMTLAIIPFCYFLIIGRDVKANPQKKWPRFQKCLKFFHGFSRNTFLMFSVILFALFGLLLAIYSLVLIEWLPQGLGGIGPRCVVFDLVKEDISEKTAAALSEAEEAAIEDQKIIRTKKVDLLFSGTNEYIIKTEDKTYEIAKNSVSIVTECS
jgi:hypothetical protein